MDLINNNPFRIIGIVSNASERELQKLKAKSKAFTRVGKEIKTDYDFNILEPICRTEVSVNKAFSDIEQNQDKVSYALFWFLNMNAIDNTALNYLSNGDFKKAVDIWEKAISNQAVSQGNFTYFNNLSTLKIFSKERKKVNEGINEKLRLINSSYFQFFIDSVADKTYIIDKLKHSLDFLNKIVSNLENRNSTPEVIELLTKNISHNSQSTFSIDQEENVINKINSQIERTSSKRILDKKNAIEYGTELFNNCKSQLILLKFALGIDNIKYKALSESFSEELLKCGVQYFNNNQEDVYGMLLVYKYAYENAKNILEISKSFAVNQSSKDKIDESLENILDLYKISLVGPAINRIKFFTTPFKSKKVNELSIGIAKKLLTEQKDQFTEIQEILGKEHKVYLTLKDFVLDISQNILNDNVKLQQEFKSEENLKEALIKAIEISSFLNKHESTLESNSKTSRIKKRLVIEKLAVNLGLSSNPITNIENHIKDLNNEFYNISNMNFLKNEILDAEDELNNIKKWQLFRMKKNKNEQLANQVEKIKKISSDSARNKQSSLDRINSKIIKYKNKLSDLKQESEVLYI